VPISAAAWRAPVRAEYRMFLIAFPLLLIPFTLYNMVAFLLNMPFSDTLFSIPLLSERRMPVTTGDLVVAIAIVLFYVEVLKAARLGAKGVMDHLLAFILFVGMAIEFVLAPKAATPVFMYLLVLGFVDVITGLSVGPRRREREIVLEDGDQAPV
jgi:hypothetical protein